MAALQERERTAREQRQAQALLQEALLPKQRSAGKSGTADAIVMPGAATPVAIVDHAGQIPRPNHSYRDRPWLVRNKCYLHNNVRQHREDTDRQISTLLVLNGQVSATNFHLERWALFQ